MVGESMSWGEALRLARMLAADPSSAIGAAVADWSYPITRETMALLDLIDVQVSKSSTKSVKPMPRPWDDAPKRLGAGSAMSIDALERVLKVQRNIATAN